MHFLVFLILLLLPLRTFAQPTVVVVGAGIAGLTTAYRLHEKGIDVQLYEARPRIGGRIFTAKIGETMIELGGHNITDGGKAENIHRLLNELHLECDENYVDLDYFYFDGQTFLSEQSLLNHATLPSQQQLAALSQTTNTMEEVLGSLFCPTTPLYQSLAVRLAAYEGASIDLLSSWYTETLFYMLQGGVCAGHQSATDENNRLKILSVKGGNATLLERMARSLGDRVHLNTPLVAVSNTADSAYELTFQNGERVRADTLVLAIPCSVYEDITFAQGVIPEERLAAICHVPYGTNAKIVIPFPGHSSQRISLINDRAVAFLDPLCRFLTLYYTGEFGKFSEETLSKTYAQDYPMLKQAFPTICPPFESPTYAQNRFIASYEGPIGYSWPNDPYVKGSYSYIAPGQEEVFTSTQLEEGEIVKTLFAPLHQRLYFAGEHATILLDVPGTMEAACESGERVARMILKQN